ncbi:alkylation response protein AidB-like acyl-CoA dehydrogenase [Bradyrhizobium sp. LM6.10]|jgi:acyl-CoA dehydrogenase
MSSVDHENRAMSGAEITVALGEDYPELRHAVRHICGKFPGEYWPTLDSRSGYPTEFVAALIEAIFLGALIPESYGGSGLPLRAAAVILEEINASGCTASAAHAQMYIMGTLLRHGSVEQKERYLPDIASGKLRLQAFGVTEPTSGSDTTQLCTRAERNGDHYTVNGQKVFTSRALHSDLMLLLARTTPRDQVKSRTDGISVFPRRLAPGKGQWAQHSTYQSVHQPQYNGSLHRESEGTCRQPDRRGREGLWLHTRRHECGRHLGGLGMHRRRALAA